MITKTIVTVLILAAIVGSIVGVKATQIMALIAAGEAFVPPPEAVASAPIEQQTWIIESKAIGTVVPVKGVTLSTELPGTITEVFFESGQAVEARAPIVKLDTSVEEAQLASAEAAAELAEINLNRSRNLLSNNTISQSEFDATEAQDRQSAAQVKKLQATIAKKTLAAPFDGRLGIRQVNIGQYLNAGTPIVSLQSIDPIYVSFFLPQNALTFLDEGLVAHATSEAFEGQTVEGEITAIAAEIDVDTRMIEVQATFPNESGLLKPGMFVNIAVEHPEARDVLAVPATAVLYASFGNSIYVVVPQTEGEGLTVEQKFVKLGKTRGDFVEILAGLEAEDRIVTAGAFKLRPGIAITLQDDRAPKVSLDPTPSDS